MFPYTIHYFLIYHIQYQIKIKYKLKYRTNWKKKPREEQTIEIDSWVNQISELLDILNNAIDIIQENRGKTRKLQ